MKNLIKTIALTGIFSIFQVNARPLEKLGSMIRTMAQSYGLHCKYPIIVQKDVINLYNSHAAARIEMNGTTNTVHNKHILFDADFVEKQCNTDPKILVALLFHENEHLDLEHSLKENTFRQEFNKGFRDFCDRKVELEVANAIDRIRSVFEEELKKCTSQQEIDLALGKAKISLSLENPAIIGLKDKLIQELQKEPGKALNRLSRLHEVEADKSVSKHADLCLSMSKYLYRPAEDLTRMSRNSPLNRDILSVYRKACNQDIEAYTALEEQINTEHPLNVRRSVYLLDMARKAPVQGSYIQHYLQWAKAHKNIQRDLFGMARFWQA